MCYYCKKCVNQGESQPTTFYPVPTVVTIFPPKLGGVRGGLNKWKGVGNFSFLIVTK